jgi:hypothetical protein
MTRVRSAVPSIGLILAAILAGCGGGSGGGAGAPAPAAPASPAPPASPALSLVDPAHVSTAGGSVILTGTGFEPGAQVRFGGVASVGAAQWISAQQLVAVAPAGAPGAVDVTVVNPDGGQATLAAALTLDPPPPPPPGPPPPPPPPSLPPPVIAAINVHGSPQAGGGLLLLAGTGLDHAASVAFGGAAASGLTYDPVQKTLLVIIPPSPSGPTADVFVPIVVVSSDGQSSSWPDFHYGNPPVLSGFTPNVGVKGDTVTISGADFTADATGVRAGLQVSFGGTLATITQKSPTQITVTVPKLNPGSFQVIVVNFDGQYAVAAGTFTVPGP